MTVNSLRRRQLEKTIFTASTLILAAAAMLFWAPGENSHAQGPNRQLVQTGSTDANAGKRLALVIGNGAYTTAPPLRNPPNDARDMASTLRALGFDVTNGINVNQREMKRLIREFGQKLKAGGSGLFYYAGHGVQSKGRNYLIPVDADIQSEVEAEDAGVDVSLVLGYMDDAQNGLNIVILDACRNNPFARSFRSASDGLAQVDAPTGTLIAYATAPGRVASDGAGQNGLYTYELLKQMRVSGLSATEMFMRVRAEVMKRTGNKQVPWEASSLVGTFYFSSPRNGAETGTSGIANETKFDSPAFELSYWETIKNSTDPEDFKAYLAKYPNGQFAELARRRSVSPPSTASPSSPAPAATRSVVDQYIKSGDELGRENKWTDAEVEYKLAVRLDPTNPEGHNKLGLALHTNRKFSEAEAEYRAALRLALNNAEAHYGISRAVREQKRLVEAESEIREAIRLEPGNAKFHASLGNTLGVYQQKYAEAEAELGQAIRLEPNNVEWHSALAKILEKQKRYAEAEAELGQAISLEPKNAGLHGVLSSLLAAQKKYAEAEAEGREALRLAPTQSWAHSFLSRLLLIQNKFAEAETEAREAIRIDPKNAYGHWLVGTTMLDQKKDAALAEPSLREAVRLEPNVGYFHHNLGVALERQKRTAEAQAEYKEALRLDPEARAEKEEEARQTKTFKGTYGIGGFGSAFFPGTLMVSPSKVEFKYDDERYGQPGFDCSQFREANVKNSSIYNILSINSKYKYWRFNAQSSSDAVSALDAIKDFCKKQ
jgi:Flp pilus assembly protein TadD